MSKGLVEIDGSLLEGGGQILRMALTISVLTRTPVHITNIRAGRSKSGLMEQHLKGLELVRDISNANVKNAYLGSTDIEFWPDKIKGGNYKASVKTAGSISLLLQVALPCTLFADIDTTLTLQGGTNAEMAPQIDYTTEVFRPVMEKFGATFDFDLIRRGYFPKGGGEVKINVRPVRNINSVQMVEEGKIKAVYGWSFVAGTLPIRMAHDMANSAVNALKNIHSNINIERYKEDVNVATGNCSGIILVAETDTGCILGGSALGKRNENCDQTGRNAVEDILDSIERNACVDQHCQDQVIVLMAIAVGLSRVKVGEVTMHTKTAIFVAEKLTNAKFNIISSGKSSIIECEGIGLKNIQGVKYDL